MDSTLQVQELMQKLREIGVSSVDLLDDKAEEGWREHTSTSSRITALLGFIVSRFSPANVIRPMEQREVEEMEKLMGSITAPKQGQIQQEEQGEGKNRESLQKERKEIEVLEELIKLEEEQNGANVAQITRLEGTLQQLRAKKNEHQKMYQEQLKGYSLELKDMRSVQQQLGTITDKEIYELQRASLDEKMSGKIAKSSVSSTNEVLSSLNSTVLKTIQSYDRVAEEANRVNQATEKIYSKWEKQNMEIEELAKDEAETELEALVIASKQHILEQQSEKEVMLSAQAKEGIKSEITDYIDILRGLIIEESLVKWKRLDRKGSALFGGQFQQLKQATAQNIAAILGEIIDQSAVLLSLAKGDHEFTQTVCDLIGSTSTVLSEDSEGLKNKVKSLKEEREKQLQLQSALSRHTIDERDEVMKTLSGLYLKQIKQPFHSYAELASISKK